MPNEILNKKELNTQRYHSKMIEIKTTTLEPRDKSKECQLGGLVTSRAQPGEKM